MIRLKLTDFFRIVSNDVERKAIDQWVAKTAKEAAAAGGLKARVSARGFADKTELGKLRAFIDDLAEFANAKVLTDRLKVIFRSQSER